MACNICIDERRAEIDNAILMVNNDSVTLETIAAEYGLDLNKLKIHALMHLNQVNGTCETSLVERLKLREAEILKNVYAEYYTTLKKLGGHVNKCINAAEAREIPLDRILAKSTIDLYLGSGNQIRETIAALAELDTALNQDKDKGMGVIRDLVAAVRG